MSDPLRIIIVDDHADTRETLRRTLDRQPDFRVVAEFADAEAALAWLAAQPATQMPDVFLVDWHLGDGRMDGIVSIRHFKCRCPWSCCLLITAYDLEHLPAEAARSGADGFIFKSDPLKALPGRIRAALVGRFPVSPKAAQYLFTTLREEGAAAAATLNQLTAREREILLFMSDGSTEKQAAAHFGLSGKTIHNHLGNAYAKLGVHSRTEALALLRRGAQRQILAEIKPSNGRTPRRPH